MTPPVFQHGQLRLYLLSLLAERPMHGYELIQALGEMFGGTYQPSPGTIYPRLAKLEEEGLVTRTEDGRKTVYTITDAGRAEFESRKDDFARIEDELSDSVRRLADEVRASVSDAMRTLRADLAAAARDVKDEARRAAKDAKGTARELRIDIELGDSKPPTASRARLHEAEALLAEFRAEVRSEFRSAAAADRVSGRAVELLRERLDEVGREVKRALRD